jgi:hypothetical protein
MHQTTVKPTIVVVVDFVTASFIVIAAAFCYCIGIVEVTTK